jgi:peptide/nickel transport system permease protein
MKIVVKKFLKDMPATAGLAIVFVVVIVAVVASHIAPYPLDAYQSHMGMRLRPPSWDHLFGTDDLGRDILSRVILGARGTLSVAVLVVTAAMAIGVPLGLFAGYYGGWFAELIMRVTDIFLAVPQLILAIAIAQLFGGTPESAIFALTATYWPFFTRVVYADTRRTKGAMFIDALECLGASGPRILFVHILPNVASSIIVRATIGVGFIILTAAVLSFLGVGATPPDPAWGLAVAQSHEFLPEAWWFSTFPGLAIFLTVLGFNLFGDGLRDLIDPRLRRSR